MSVTSPSPERNLPCPCGSGRKFKRCCEQQGRSYKEMIQGFAAAIAQLHEANLREAERIAQFGEGRPLIHANFNGHKFVAVGPELHYSEHWRTFRDFLRDYVVCLLGEEWFNAEVNRPEAARHPVMDWRWGHYEAVKKLTPGPDGLIASSPTGHEAALLTLANDLFVLRHNGAFRDDILERLRHRDQFAGARYELFAAATCVRAGMTVQHEDERDRSRRHVEFIATHSDLGLKVAVEAKQRHRQPGRPAPLGAARPEVTSLVNKALAKQPGLPMIVFADMDMDPPLVSANDWTGKLVKEIRREMASVEANARGPLAASMILVTNIAYWRAGSSPAPAMMFYTHVPTHSQFPLPGGFLDSLCNAAATHRNIPNDNLGTVSW